MLKAKSYIHRGLDPKGQAYGAVEFLNFLSSPHFGKVKMDEVTSIILVTPKGMEMKFCLFFNSSPVVK